MAPIREKALAALNAMKAIGIPMQTSKPVLKNLLKVYENNWEYIEAENYRVLADAILDIEESQEEKHKKKMIDDGNKGKNVVKNDEPEPLRTRGTGSKSKNVVENDEPEPLRTRVRFRREDHDLQSSKISIGSHCETSLKRPKLEADVLPEGHPDDRREELSHSRSLRGKTIEPAFPQPSTTGTSQMSVVVPDTTHLQLQLGAEQKHDTNNCSSNLVRPKDEPCDYDSAVFETPVAVIHPKLLSPRSTASQDQARNHHLWKHSTTLKQNVNGSTTKDGQMMTDKEALPVDACDGRTTTEILSVQETSSLSVNIASSDLGEVKLYFSCNPDQPDFHMPNMEEVFKLVEDRCLKSYRTIQPSLSLTNLMREMCQCFVELGSKSTDDKQENVVEIIPTVDFLKKSIIQDAPNISPLVPNVSFPLIAPIGSSITRISAPNQNDRGNNQNGRRKHRMEPELSESANVTPHSLVLVQHPQHVLGELRPLHDVTDISKGEERVRISVVNEITGDKYPPSFNYIPRNIVYQQAYVNFSLARIGDEDCCPDCFNDCITAQLPCACARETGGEFAYTSDGLLKKEFLDECISMCHEPQKHHMFYCQVCPLERSKNEATPEACKGHLVRKFIKECWSKCGCSMHCGNRVVQRGITRNLQVFHISKEKGWGVRALDELPRGAFICEYVGEVLTNMELYDRTILTTGNAKHTYPVLLDADWGSEGALKDEEALCLDATFYGNVARFINHRCYDANLIEIPVEVETPDHHYYHIAFFTTRKVEAFEELTWDYGIDFNDHDHPVKAFKCRCGSRSCRDIKRRRRLRV